MKELELEGLLYSVPSNRVDDDWYWLYAAISPAQSAATVQPYVITNDLMRDHKFSLLHSDSFMRWRNAQIVYFSLNRPGYINFKENATALARVIGKTNRRNFLRRKGSTNNTTDSTTTSIEIDDQASHIEIEDNLDTQRTDDDNNQQENVSPTMSTDNIFDSNATGNLHIRTNLSNLFENNIVENEPSEDWDIPGNVHFFPPGNFSRDVQFDSTTNYWHLPALEKNIWLCVTTNTNL